MGNVLRESGPVKCIATIWSIIGRGQLFEDRYKSEAFETDKYLKAVIGYIHHNPIKVGMVKGHREV